jgi:MFS family permease
VLSGYALSFAGLLLPGGRAADLLGRRRVFTAGVVIFTAASLLCGRAWSPARWRRPAWSRGPARRS